MPGKSKSHKVTKATAEDARLILELYDLRREQKMREARDFMAQEFWPQSYDDFMKLVGTIGSEENRHFRQTMTYWDMAASLVVHGAKLRPVPSQFGRDVLLLRKDKAILEGTAPKTWPMDIYPAHREGDRRLAEGSREAGDRRTIDRQINPNEEGCCGRERMTTG